MSSNMPVIAYRSAWLRWDVTPRPCLRSGPSGTEGWRTDTDSARGEAPRGSIAVRFAHHHGPEAHTNYSQQSLFQRTKQPHMALRVSKRLQTSLRPASTSRSQRLGCAKINDCRLRWRDCTPWFQCQLSVLGRAGVNPKESGTRSAEVESSDASYLLGVIRGRAVSQLRGERARSSLLEGEVNVTRMKPYASLVNRRVTCRL